MAEATGRKRAAADRGKQVLDAALRVFSEKGYERATTKAIAAEAGVAEGTIFIYFPTKRDILVGCMQQEIFEPLPKIFSDDSASEEEVIRAFFRNRFEALRANVGLFKLVVSESPYNPDLHKVFLERIFGPVLTEVSGYFARKMEAGNIRTLDPMMVARSLMGQVILTAWMQIVSGADLDEMLSEDRVETLTAIFLDGVRARM